MRQPVIEFKDFSFRYKVQTEFTLNHIDLTIYRGEKVLILGPSGSGKSTLANCINGLIPFSFNGEIKGSCKIAGQETSEASIFRLSDHVGTVLQDSDAQFVGLSVGEDIAFALENISMPREEMLPKVDAAAKLVGMGDFLAHVPYNLSGGQKQKVSLAGVMHEDVDILVFDEPLAALDPTMGMTAVDLIDQIHKSQNKTIIIIEHRLEDVLYRSVDRIVLINNGSVVLDTTPDELLRSDTLKQHGIREPLYITALKHAGCKLSDDEHLSSIVELDVSKYKKKILEHMKKKTSEIVVEKEERILEVSNVDFYYGENQALKDVSFDIYAKEKIALIGKNGAGKSTMAKALCGIIRPKKGTVILNSENYLKYSIKEIGNKIGYVMQNPNQMLVKDLVKEEVELALILNDYDAQMIEERVKSTLEMCGLYSMRNWPIAVLSYGQRKRVTVASILALQPSMIILDEPTAGQDYKHYTEIMGFLDELNRDFGITIIFITHDMHLAIEYTNRAIVFADGECIADDSVFKVLSNDEVITRANLKQTSLYTLAKLIGIEPEDYIRHFIEYEREVRNDG